MPEMQLIEAMVSAELLSEAFREPSITAYNRLEPRPRSQNFERSIRAEIRDPLWMLTRQWQMGEFEAEDAGSAIDARLLTRQIHVDRISFDHSNGRAYDDQIPMETFVERENIKFEDGDLSRTYGLRVRMGQHFLKLHSPALLAAYASKYLLHFGFEQNLDEEFRGQTDGLNLYVATRARSIDGAKIHAAIADGSFSSVVGIDPADVLAIDELCGKYLAWFARQYSLPVEEADDAWHPQTLDYQVSIAAPYEDGEQMVLEASEYYSGSLEWYSFDENGASAGISETSGALPVDEEEVISFIPAAASFKGMPNPRFWEIEDRRVNFGSINAKTTDQLLLLFAEFGLIYGNDWSVIPYNMPVNTICEVKGLVITDAFGDRTLIRAANEGDENAWQRWSMFNLSDRNSSDSPVHFFLPSVLHQTLESDPIEKVNFIRDEMANMVWGVEDVIPDAAGKGINGHEAADQTGVLPEPIEDSTAEIRYLLGVSVPENWIPFLPVQKTNTQQDIYLQRAAMPKLGDVDVVNAKGALLNEAPTPYYINEEEIPYSGTIVTRSYQRTRWYNGKTYIWIGRQRKTGRGQGASNLRFDQIEPPNEGG